jgi:aspartate carbamoyltransferase catalytic subunit
MKNSLYKKSVVSIQDLTLEEFKLIFAKANEYKKNEGLILGTSNPLKDKIIASTFFEASTRTRLSFEAAANRLGARVIGFADSNNTSLGAKGEGLKDTLKIIGGYADLLVIRHPQEGSARLAAEVCQIPVINAGDGANQHPTQTLLDLFTMQSITQLEGLHLVLIGDLRYGRTLHSLVQIAHLFKMRLYFVAFEQLTLPETLLFQLKCQAVQFSFHKNLEEVIPVADILYLTRIQKERFAGPDIPKPLVLTKNLLKKAKKTMKILHPLPRQEELPREIDTTPHAYYFEQAQNGIYIRAALLDLILNDKEH